ncbi:acetyltransferase, gnat family [Ruegeria lacuscaerulensis ITI-1157]|nr:acetyltransferase, gnat family [Ruegeria lacuscaerulensis ITI-1157]SHI63709.1 Ribosomal protein S18 acetylase RimI [Ruegeria lacuscaerulensis ITI-1157]
MTEITLRPAVEADAESIRLCIDAAYAVARQTISDLPDVSGGVEDDIRDSHVVVAESSTRLLGVLVYGFEREVAMIFNLAVSPDAQGRGIARRLLDFAETEARRRQIRVLRLTTHRLMAGTRAMYRHLGWREVAKSGNRVFLEKSV